MAGLLDKTQQLMCGGPVEIPIQLKVQVLAVPFNYDPKIGCHPDTSHPFAPPVHPLGQ